MSFDRQHSGREIDRESARDHGPDVPGRRAATEGLVGGGAPTASGLVSRKERFAQPDPEARDGDGVTADASHHLDRAAGSSGHALPDALRDQFEGSLGHDLGGVRLHTGADSAAAADAVGARAFATGNDIHFGRGEYDPHSSEGQRLIAHEVVHTVQQAGSAPTTQYKLAVSSPGDAHEVEADDLADVMVSRRPAAVGPTPLQSGGLARKPMRSAPIGIHRWRASERHGFRRASELPWVKENPADPWNHGPNDYVAVGSAMPAPAGDRPQDIAPMWAGRWPEPLDGRTSDGKAYDLPPMVTVDKANTAIDALETVMDTVVATHNTMAPKIRDYATASEQVKPDGFYGPAPGGLNWAAPKDGAPANAGQLAEKQMPTGGKASIGDVFNGGSTAQGVSDKTVAAGQQAAVSGLLEAARKKDDSVKDRVKDYRQHIVYDIAGAVRGVQAAYTKLAIKKENDKKDEAETKIKDLEDEKKEALETIGTAGKVIEKGAKVLEGDVGATRELILLGAEKIVSSQFEKEIKAQQGIIKGAKGKIRSLEQSLVELAIQDALDALAKKIEDLAGKRQAVVLALKDRQDAYDAAAAEAKKQAIAHGADPKEAERLQTVIAAIPRIEVVLTKLREIVSAAVVPGYNPTAGLAYAVGRNGNQGIDAPAFERAIGGISHYRGKYEAERTVWQGRLDSAKAIEAGLNVPSAQAKP